jgi:hypothetical protein
MDSVPTARENYLRALPAGARTRSERPDRSSAPSKSIVLAAACVVEIIESKMGSIILCYSGSTAR